MFAAVGLFVLLMAAMLYLAFVRFRNPPVPAPSTVGAVVVPTSNGSRLLLTRSAHPRFVHPAGSLRAFSDG